MIVTEQILRHRLDRYLIALSDPLAIKILEVLRSGGRMPLKKLMMALRIPPDNYRSMISPTISKLIQVNAINIYTGENDRRYRFHEINPEWDEHLKHLERILKAFGETKV